MLLPIGIILTIAFFSLSVMTIRTEKSLFAKLSKDEQFQVLEAAPFKIGFFLLLFMYVIAVVVPFVFSGTEVKAFNLILVLTMLYTPPLAGAFNLFQTLNKQGLPSNYVSAAFRTRLVVFISWLLLTVFFWILY